MQFFMLFFRIITQPRLNWWPQVELLYSRSGELRAMFTDTLNKATQVCLIYIIIYLMVVCKYVFFNHILF